MLTLEAPFVFKKTIAHAVNDLRPLTTLKPVTEFKLLPAERKTNFFFFWMGKFGRVKPGAVLLQLVSDLIYPDLQKTKIDVTPYLADAREDGNIGGLFAIKSILRKDLKQKCFFFSTPLARVRKYGFSLKQNSFLKSQLKNEDLLPVIPETLSGKQVSDLVSLQPNIKQALQHGLISVEFKQVGDLHEVWFNWVISKQEAEYINGTAFLEIKPSNFYPTLVDWSNSMMGHTEKIPETISPVTKIASQVKDVTKSTTLRPRVGIDGMLIDNRKQVYVIPDIDQSRLYEQMLADFGTQDDGSYSYSVDTPTSMEFDASAPSQRKKLPINMPVFTDWLNDKFCYSNSSGNLAIYDLGPTVPVKAFHMLQVLDALFVHGKKGSPSNAALTGLQLASKFDPTILSERPSQSEIEELVGKLDEEGKYKIEKILSTIQSAVNIPNCAVFLHSYLVGDKTDFYTDSSAVDAKTEAPRLWQLHAKTGLASMRFIGRMFERALKVVSGNLDAMYTQYSVMTVLNVMAVLNILVNHSARRADIDKEDKTERDAYLNQGIDPEYTVEGQPSIRKNFKHYPHQFRVHNQMRKGPKFAIWAVDAGGGKTPIAIINTLNELKNKRCVRPLILCPAHLVSNYVKELVYVCQGRINIIPVTNTTLKVHGEEKLFEFITRSPANTIVISDFNTVSARGKDIAYGNKAIRVYRNAEFLRQFNFDMVVVDECHFLKNDTARTHAAARLIQDIPMKRLASGTFIADTIQDVVAQVALLDPTLFGSKDYFRDEFAAESKGNKILALEPGAEIAIRKRIGQHCVYAQARRKEWAAALPPSTEKFFGAELTPNQRLLYDAILKETTEKIEEAIAKDPALREMMESDDESVMEQLEGILRPYMARLERFLSAPVLDVAADVFLKAPEDRVSPKVNLVYERCREHVKIKAPGKVLVFTQYTGSAQAVYDNAPPDLKPHFIHYKASDKIEARTAFEKDPNKKFMVGVSSSMDVGLNFQHVSRLIRMETVWTPGVQEQGNSRINRPQFKEDEVRPHIYFDWLVINKTIDITKVSRLIAKVISKAKYDEFDNPNYTNLADLPPTPLTIRSIQEHNDWNESLYPYLEGYQEYDRVKREDYAEYRRIHGDKLVPVAVPQAGVLPGSKLMSRIPYIPDMDIYKTDELGLVRYDQFIRQDLVALNDDLDDSEGDDGDDDEDNGVDEKSEQKQRMRELLAKERALVVSRSVHTEFGDGVITGVSPKRVRLRLSDGTVIRVAKSQCFIITRSTTNSVDMRNELLRQIDNIPLDKPIDVPVEKGSADKKREDKGRGKVVEKQPKVEDNAIELSFSIINDHLGIVYSESSDDSSKLNVLANFGFQISPEYVYTKILGPKTCLAFFRALKKQGFKLDMEANEMFSRLYTNIQHDRSMIGSFGFASKMELKNFYRMQMKPSADPKLLKIYPVITDGRLYAMLPTKGQTSTTNAIKVTVSGIKWVRGGGANEVIRFVSTKKEAQDVLKEIIDAGLKIANLKELGEQYKKIKLVNR